MNRFILSQGRMKGAAIREIAVSCLLLVVVFPLAGCVPVATGVITYTAAVSHENHSAYTEYLFATQATNEANKNAGLPEQSILPEDKWLKEIHLPRLEYAEYYSEFAQGKFQTNALIPFDHWDQTQREKFREHQRAMQQQKTSTRGK